MNDLTLEKPYFLKIKDWYYFDERSWMYRLTEKAPKKAIQSYNEFYKEIEYEH